MPEGPVLTTELTREGLPTSRGILQGRFLQRRASLLRASRAPLAQQSCLRTMRPQKMMGVPVMTPWTMRRDRKVTPGTASSER